MRGHCLCGAVAFEIAGGLPNLYQCHCSLCRKQSGAASNAATIVDATQLTWLKGHDRIKSWIKDTGFRSDFCVECGSPVPNQLRDKPYYWVPAGLLDSTGMSEIRIHLHLASKASWEKALHPSSAYDESPSIEQLLEELKRGPDA